MRDTKTLNHTLRGTAHISVIHKSRRGAQTGAESAGAESTHSRSLEQYILYVRANLCECSHMLLQIYGVRGGRRANIYSDYEFVHLSVHTQSYI